MFFISPMDGFFVAAVAGLGAALLLIAAAEVILIFYTQPKLLLTGKRESGALPAQEHKTCAIGVKFGSAGVAQGCAGRRRGGARRRRGGAKARTVFWPFSSPRASIRNSNLKIRKRTRTDSVRRPAARK